MTRKVSGTRAIKDNTLTEYYCLRSTYLQVFQGFTVATIVQYVTGCFILFYLVQAVSKSNTKYLGYTYMVYVDLRL